MDFAGAAVWRPRLWVRVAAIVAAIILAVPLMLPRVANPGWTHGTPADQAGWLFGLLTVALLLVWCAWAAKIEVNAGEVRVINLLKVHRLPKASVVEVRPGPLGIEFVDRHGRRTIGVAVQSTAVYFGDRPRWVDIAEAVTGVAPDWEMD